MCRCLPAVSYRNQSRAVAVVARIDGGLRLRLLVLGIPEGARQLLPRLFMRTCSLCHTTQVLVKKGLRMLGSLYKFPDIDNTQQSPPKELVHEPSSCRLVVFPDTLPMQADGFAAPEQRAMYLKQVSCVGARTWVEGVMQ